MSVWSVRLSLPDRTEYGATAIGDAALARETYEAWVVLIKQKGVGKVEIMQDEEIVDSFELPEAKG